MLELLEEPVEETGAAEEALVDCKDPMGCSIPPTLAMVQDISAATIVMAAAKPAQLKVVRMVVVVLKTCASAASTEVLEAVRAMVIDLVNIVEYMAMSSA